MRSVTVLLPPTVWVLPIVAAMLWLLLAASSVHAEHFAIELSITSDKGKTTSFSDTNTPERPQGFKPRPAAHAKAGEDLIFQFFFASNFPHDVQKNVTVRYYIVAEEKAGQDKVPARDNAITAGYFVMDFKTVTGKAGLRQKLKIDKPGAYLVRVESENSDSDHEHFSALDLVVE